MPLLLAALAFLLPLIALLLWRAFRPGQQPSTWLVVCAFLAVVLAIGGAITYGMNRSIERGERYVPPTWQRDGERVEPGHAAPR
jgi:4-amino-4-deoxy-L-arabinose transferase-like glycosyltransferase